jgi:hypothetical protein
MKMATAAFAETLQHVQHTTLLNPESRSFSLIEGVCEQDAEENIWIKRKEVTLICCPFSLFKHHVMRRLEVQLYAFLTSELGGAEWSASRFGHFTDAVVKREITVPARNRTPDFQLADKLTDDPGCLK